MSISLKINVATIPDEGLNLAFSEEGRRFERCFQDGHYKDFSLLDVEINCQITKTSSTIFIKGNLSVLLKVACSRCLEDTSLSAGNEFAYTLVPAKQEVKEELELTADDLETSYYSGDFVDLTTIICEQIALQIPFKPLCKEECLGLCPHCGINRNVDPCSCQRAPVDERMTALKNFKIKNK